MRQVGGVHRADEGDVVHHAGEVRHHLRDPRAALAVPGELERAAHQGAGVLDELDFARDLVEVRLAVVLVERRLGVEQVHLAGAAVHEQMDDRLGLGREVRRARLEVDRRIRRLFRGEDGGGAEVAAEQVGQGRPGDAAGHPVEETAAGQREVCHVGHRLTPLTPPLNSGLRRERPPPSERLPLAWDVCCSNWFGPKRSAHPMACCNSSGNTLSPHFGHSPQIQSMS